MKARYLLLGGLAALGIALALTIRGPGPAVERSTGVIRGPHGSVEIRYLLCSGQRLHFVRLLDYGPGLRERLDRSGGLAERRCSD